VSLLIELKAETLDYNLIKFIFPLYQTELLAMLRQYVVAHV